MAGQLWRHGEHVAYVDSGERVVLLDLSRQEDEPRILSPSASAVWRCIDGIRTDEAIVAAVADQYELAPEAIENDVLSFLTELIELGLITAEQPG